MSAHVIDEIELKACLSLDPEIMKAAQQRIRWAEDCEQLHHFGYDNPSFTKCIWKLFNDDIQDIEFLRNYIPSDSDSDEEDSDEE
jgi:hypothetical protein